MSRSSVIWLSTMPPTALIEELVPVPAVVERVDDDADVVVLRDVAALPPHVVGNDAMGLAVVRSAR
jgi:hypothetical protein